VLGNEIANLAQNVKPASCWFDFFVFHACLVAGSKGQANTFFHFPWDGCESSPKNILGQVESGVTFGPAGDQFPHVRTIQLDCEKVGGGRTLFLYEIAIKVPLRQKLNEVPESISLITSAASELFFLNYVRQFHPGTPSASPTLPSGSQKLPSATNPRLPQAQPQSSPTGPAAAATGASTSWPQMLLSIQKEPGYLVITCSPKIEGSELQTADLNASSMRWRPVLTGTNNPSTGWYVPPDDGARAFRVKLSQATPGNN
jgi:hypothetical protein